MCCLYLCEDSPLAWLVFVEEGKGSAICAPTGRATDAMGVGARGAGKVDVDHEIDGLKINAAVDSVVCCFGGKGRRKKGKRVERSESPREGGR